MCGGGGVLQWTSRMILARIGWVVCAVVYGTYGHNNMTEGFKKRKRLWKKLQAIIEGHRTGWLVKWQLIMRRLALSGVVTGGCKGRIIIRSG